MNDKQFPALAGARANLLRAATKYAVTPMSQAQAHDLRGFLSNFRMDIKGRRAWLRDKIKNLNLGLEVDFTTPNMIDIDEVKGLLRVLAAIDAGDDTQAKAYTPAGARAFLNYVIHLNRESEFLLDLQRMTLAHEREMNENG